MDRYLEDYHDPTGWLMSEKFDGVFAQWTGSELLTRSGNHIAAPDWFLALLPPVSVAGELWTGHGQFETVVSIVRSKTPDDRWHQVRFLLFDCPPDATLRTPSRVVRIEHTACSGVDHLDQFHQNVVLHGGEGVVLWDPKTNKRLKVKQVNDTDVVVVGYEPGKGKYQGQTGALRVREGGKQFRVGVGLDDDDRRNPPAIGSVVKVQFEGRTAKGIPRFPRFAGTRAEQEAMVSFG